MPGLRKKIRGRIYKDCGKALLLIDDEASFCFLAFALLEVGTEREIFPESLLDDWGHEIDDQALYEWINENGIHFPRAELFGFDGEGRHIQLFLRELDPIAKYSCYVFEERRQAISEGIPIVAIGILEGNLEQPVRIGKPPGVKAPLNNARVQWWQIGPGCSTRSILAIVEASV